jgi:hypothetical protein
MANLFINNSIIKTAKGRDMEVVLSDLELTFVLH